MSFWKDVGDFLDDAGSSTSGAFGSAWSFATDVADGVDSGVHAVGDVLAFPGRHAVDNPVTRGLGWTWRNVIDRPAATTQLAADQTGGNSWLGSRLLNTPDQIATRLLMDPGAIREAWNTTGQEDLSFGQAGYVSLRGSFTEEDRTASLNTWVGKLSSGAADFAFGWYADPLVAVGKGMQAVRKTKTQLKSNEERKQVLDYAAGRTNAGQVEKRTQKLGDRFNKMIASTDGLTASEIAQKPGLRDSADAGALAYLFERANLEHATDEAARHQAKRDIYGAALGDARSISRLRAQRQELADEMRRLAEPPPQTRFDEAFTWDDNGQGAFDLFNNSPDPLDLRLQDQISAKLEKLDRALGTTHTTSKIGGTFWERQRSDYQISQSYLYSGMAGKPTRVIAGATAERLPGYVSLKDPVSGFQEFKKTLDRMVHTEPQLRKTMLDDYLRASNAGERRMVVDKAEGQMVNDIAAKYGITPKAAGALLKAGQGRRGAALKALAGRLYSATDADKWISVVDAEADELLALSKPLARTQIEDLHPIMDPDLVDKFLRVGTHQRAVERFAARFGQQGRATKLADSAASVRDWSEDAMLLGTRIWKDSALFRLAYPMRVQVDTQMRLLTHMGAMQYMSIMPSAVKGQGKYLLQGRMGQGRLRSLFSAPEELEDALESTLMKGGNYRGFSLDPAQSMDDIKVIARRLYDGNGSMADLLSEVSSADLRAVRKTGDWGIVEPDNEGWATAYSRAVNRQIFESPTMQQALLTTDRAALKKWVTSTKEGQAEWREMKPGWQNLDDWLDAVEKHVEHYLPTAELRGIVSTRKLSAEDIKTHFDGKASGNRMRVHGEALSPNHSGMNRIHEKWQEIRKGWYRWASDAPETIMGRSPLYASGFKHYMKQQIDRLGPDDLVDEVQIRRNADRLARRDVGRILFDTSNVSNMATHFRFLSPFFAAWEDTMKKWGRLIYDDPSRAGRLMQVWDAPNRMGLVVDSEGNRIDAQGHAYNSEGKRVDNQPGYRGRGQYVTLPAGLAGPMGIGEFRLNKESFNVTFQGEPWWLPGFGPTVQIPANEIVRRAFPQESEDPILRYVLPFGVTEDSAMRQLAPSWAKRAKDAFGGTQDYNNTFDLLMKQEVVRYNLGERATKPDAEEIAGRTRNWFILRAALAFNSPVTAQPTPKLQLYVDKGREYQRKYGEQWQEKFYQDFPEYYELTMSLSKNDTGIVASEQAFDATKRYRKLIGQHPEFGWMFVGPANDPAEPFNAGVYTWQGTAKVSPGSDQTYRSKKSPEESLKDAEASKGWIQYRQMKTKVDELLKQRGLTSLSQKDAEPIKTFWEAFRADLGAKNTSWLSDYENRGPDRVRALVRAASDGIRSDKSLRDRADMKALSEYIKVRAEVQKILASRDVKSLDREENADVKQLWDAFTLDLKERSFGFSQMLDRTLESDDLKGELSLG